MPRQSPMAACFTTRLHAVGSWSGFNPLPPPLSSSRALSRAITQPDEPKQWLSIKPKNRAPNLTRHNSKHCCPRATLTKIKITAHKLLTIKTVALVFHHRCSQGTYFAHAKNVPTFSPIPVTLIPCILEEVCLNRTASKPTADEDGEEPETRRQYILVWMGPEKRGFRESRLLENLNRMVAETQEQALPTCTQALQENLCQVLTRLEAANHMSQRIQQRELEAQQSPGLQAHAERHRAEWEEFSKEQGRKKEAVEEEHAKAVGRLSAQYSEMAKGLTRFSHF
ncbi:BL1S5 protein, partial [Atractosteus spatula]|nr:BL1S5 protein [Atractosteus spatula]